MSFAPLLRSLPVVAGLVLAALLVSTAPATAGTVTGTDDPWNEPDIPDYNGDPSQWTGNLHREISISGAPGGARVTSVTIRLDLHHTYIGDLYIWYGTSSASHTIWNRSGGSGGGIHQTFTSSSQFDGISPNTTWHLYIKDMAAQDTGELESWSVTITYADCVVDSDCGTWEKCSSGSCVAKTCADLGYPLGTCGSASSDGDCKDSYTEVWECVDAGPFNCWSLRDGCSASEVCYDTTFSSARCVPEGNSDYCAAEAAAGSACGHGEADCDFDSECSGSLVCKGSIFGGGVDGCCWSDEDWDGSNCIAQDCASLGYPLGECGTASSDGECMAGGDEVWRCIDAGPTNCWTRYATCTGSDVCFDALTAAATCISDGENEYCRARVDAGSACSHGQSDCDYDSECSGSLECVGSVLGGTIDGCCWSDEDWNGSSCVPKDCASLGYPLGSCGTATNDGECMAGGDEVWRCVDVGPANCWTRYATCTGSDVCYDALTAAATCISEGHAEYCAALVDAGSACQHGQADCDFDSECAGSLQCAGSIFGGGVDGCCTTDEDWDGAQCVPRDCASLGYPLGACGTATNDGECMAGGDEVWRCIDAGPANCWSRYATCTGSDVCYDALTAAATCISEGHAEYCAALVDAGSACQHGQADCDFDSECAGSLQCAGSIFGGGVDGCCTTDEDWNGSSCIPRDCAALGYPLGSCGVAASDGECMMGGAEVWQCVDAGPVNCWSVREECTGSDVCFDALTASALCISDGENEYCRALVDAGSVCEHGQSDCDFNSECAAGLECVGSVLGGTIDGCCTANEDWDGATCVPKDCASLGYPLGACGLTSGDGECMASGTEVWQCVDAGPSNCWQLRETCTGTDICFDGLTSAAACISDGENEYCRARTEAGSSCEHGQSDCDFDSECAGDLVCSGSVLGGTIDGCCTEAEDWNGVECVPAECGALGYPLGPCGLTSGDGECSPNGGAVWQCVDAGPLNCWQLRETCQGTDVCYDALTAAALCIAEGHAEYCAARVDAGSACQHGQADCDFDSECAGDLHCAGPIIGGGVDGCCDADEDWDGAQCIPRDCVALGYPLGPCGLTGTDGECSGDFGAVHECVDAGPVNCWQLRETCAGTAICQDPWDAAAACIDDGHADYCAVLVDAGSACQHGQADCDFDSQCAGDLQCAGSIFGGGVDGCCNEDEDWDGAACVPKDCVALGYPLGACGIAANDGECADDFRAVHQCVDAGPVNCWQVRETCAGTAVCRDGLLSGATCIDDGDEDYCVALGDAGTACQHGQSDCDFDSQCLGDLVCVGPVFPFSGLDGCCRDGEEWDGERCIGENPCDECQADETGCEDATHRWTCAFDTVEGCYGRVVTACGPEEACSEGVCQPATTTCVASADCPAEQHCADGRCEPDLCGQGGTACRGPAVVTCAADGATFTIDEACGVGAGCQGGTCTCLTDEGCAAEEFCPFDQIPPYFTDFDANPGTDPEWDVVDRRWTTDAGALVCVLDDANVAAVNDGAVTAVGITVPGAPPEPAGGQIDSARADFQYGSYRARIRTSREPHTNNAFFFYDGATGQEIDVEIYPGNGPGNATVDFVVHPRPNDQEGAVSLPLAFDPAAGYHEYGFDRYPDHVAFLIDDQIVARIGRAWGHPNITVPDAAGAIILSHWTAAPPHYLGGPPEQTARMRVDWVSFTPFGGACQPDRCPQGQTYCEGLEVRRCRADGGAYEVVEVCPQTCAAGSCAGSCVSNAECDPGAYCANGQCVTDLCPQGQAYCAGNERRQCWPEGDGSDFVETCPEGCELGACTGGVGCVSDAECASAQHCADGQCAADVCPQGENFCDGADRRRCDPNGSSSVRIQTCEFGCAAGVCLDATVCGSDADCESEFWCDSADGTCRPDVCEAGRTFCDAGNVYRCAVNGSDAQFLQTCQAGCVDGQCVGGPDCVTDVDCEQDRWCDGLGVCQPDVCQQGRAFCDGAELRSCNANGSDSTLDQVCPDGCQNGACVGGGGCAADGDCRPDEFCNGQSGRCSVDVCPQGGLFCDGVALRRCDAVGSSSSLVESCTLGCEAGRCMGCLGPEDCDPNEFCTLVGTCEADVCAEGTTYCDGAKVMACDDDGGGTQFQRTCPNGCAGGDCLAACDDDAQCAADESCEGGNCVVSAACQGVTWQGCCDGATIHWCDHGVLELLDCGQEGLGCGWLADGDWFWCTGEPQLPPDGLTARCPWSTCTPSCTGRVCGSDGCEGSCGSCGEGEACQDGTCVSCTPSCDGVQCGDDGCGGTCGECVQGQRCEFGFCEACEAECRGAECGDDGCGGTCGACGEGYACAAGACVCVPNCRGRQCGDDGCGGTCGDCALGWACQPTGRCGANPPGDDTGGGGGDKDTAGGDDTGGGWTLDITAPDAGAPPDGGSTNGGGDSSGCTAGAPASPAPAWPLLALLAALLAVALPRRRRD